MRVGFLRARSGRFAIVAGSAGSDAFANGGAVASALTWLDFSDRDQRRARELIQLFMQPESRDELGIGPVRDALSDALFPGVSVIHTRARYFLFVPWLFQEGVRRGHHGQALLAWVGRWQRKHVEVLRSSGAVDGLIGRLAGPAVKILPSTIYWNALQQFGVLRVAGPQDVVAGLRQRDEHREDAMTERTSRVKAVWDDAMPDAPVGFPDVDTLTFRLSRDEAQWLSERVQQSASGKCLGWLAGRGVCLESDTSGPWQEASLSRAPRAIREEVHHADMFSLVMHGAPLLYNVLLARRSKVLGLTELARYDDVHSEALRQWAEDISARKQEVLQWDRGSFWNLILRENPRVSLATRMFVEHWFHMVVRDDPKNVVNGSDAQAIIKSREQFQKRAQSRFVNDRLLKQWGGSSGTERLTYRWGQVKSMLNDIVAGCSRARA
jgi:hypothetical protein